MCQGSPMSTKLDQAFDLENPGRLEQAMKTSGAKG